MHPSLMQPLLLKYASSHLRPMLSCNLVAVAEWDRQLAQRPQPLDRRIQSTVGRELAVKMADDRPLPQFKQAFSGDRIGSHGRVLIRRTVATLIAYVRRK